MQQRRGTASQWTSADPILAAGEIGVETDTNKFKIGNGVTDWQTLNYFEDSAGIQGLVDALVSGAPESLDTLNELAAALNDDPNFFTRLDSKLDVAGGTITGNLAVDGTTTLSADPVVGLEAATKQYVDAAQTAATQAVGDLTDVDNTTLGDGYTLLYNNSNSTWETALAVTNISNLSGVSLTSPEDGDVLTYSSDSGDFENRKSTPYFPDNAQSTDYVAVLGDLTQSIAMNSTSDATVFVPFHDDVTFPNGSVLRVLDDSDNNVFIAGQAEDYAMTVFPFAETYAVSEIIYENNIYVAVLNSDNGQPTSDIAVSSDGSTWTIYNTLPSAQKWSCASYNPDLGRFLVVAGGVDNSSSVAAYSDDNCQTWTSVALPTSREWVSTAYGDGFFVIVGDGTASAPYSVDGVTWNTGNINAFSAWRSVTYANGNFVVVSTTNSSSAAYVQASSPSSWTASTLPTTADWLDVVYGNGRVVAIGEGGSATTTNTGAFSTTNGQTWSSFTLPVTDKFINIKFTDGYYLVSSPNGSTYASLDLVDWTEITTSVSDASSRIGAGNYRAVYFGGAGSNNFGVARVPVILRNAGRLESKYVEVSIRKRSDNEWVATGSIV